MLRTGSPSPRDLTLVRLLWMLTLVLVVISVAIVARRTLSLFGLISASSTLSRSGPVDAAFTQHAALTMLHIFPGLVFIVFGPLQFVKTLRTRTPAVHRRIGYIVLTSGLVTGVTALAMTTQVAIGGTTEKAATAVFGVLFLFALARAFACIRRRRVALHREWMIRAFSLGLAVATIRPIVGIFFATQGLTGLTPPEFFGIAFWIGFTMHLIAAEAWISRQSTVNSRKSTVNSRKSTVNSRKSTVNSRKSTVNSRKSPVPVESRQSRSNGDLGGRAGL